MSRITLTAASRVGCIRSNNEDMVFAYDKFVRSDAYQTEFMTENSERFLIALADGMGGHNAGEVASEQTLSSLKFFINDIPRGFSVGEFEETMMEWLQFISDSINRRGHADPSLRDMGTTLIAVIFYGGKYYWLNCGDSRLYRLRDGKLKNAYLDIFEFTDDFRSGDIYMLCSDGLNDMISHDDIEKLMNEGNSANGLCEAAIEAGGFDNVSVCVFHVD